MIVGETAYDRAVKVLINQQSSMKGKFSQSVVNEPEPALGTLEEYFNDSLDGFKFKMQKQQDSFTQMMQEEHQKLIESVNSISETNSAHLSKFIEV